MNVRSLLLMGICLMAVTDVARAEGGCPHGQTPKLYGDVWGCAPGGNDAPTQGQPVAPPTPTGYWETTWGAFAANGLKGILGTVVGKTSKGEAERGAMDQCRANGGGDGCKVSLAYFNQCAALVTGNREFLVQGAETEQLASSLGMQKCNISDENCRVHHSECTKPIFHPY
ncbi:DUF4189 domain-containing protein [Lysobacter sp. CA199]|uniref:DUF4189 domain-containing protein n=1 Tax=Lysobacter sp. CA199 TaxID=3455608 RepID=UPI003F8D1618